VTRRESDAETTRALNRIVSALKAERQARGLTLGDVADAIGSSVPQLSTMERGGISEGRPLNPLASFLIRWASALDLELTLIPAPDRPPATRSPRRPRDKLSPTDRDRIRDARGLVRAVDLATIYRVSRQAIYGVWKDRP
jgi:transcriptional regulator with XRE-family HTH domain